VILKLLEFPPLILEDTFVVVGYIPDYSHDGQGQRGPQEDVISEIHGHIQPQAPSDLPSDGLER